MYSQTVAVLEKFDNQHDFERMSADLLIALGRKDVALIAPRGGSDGGMDITFTTESGGKGLACVTLRPDIEAKFNEDFSKRRAGEFEKYILFCTAHLTASKKLKFARYCLDNLQAEFVPQDIESLRGLLDAFTSIRERYLGIKDLRLPQLKLGFYENDHVLDEIARPVLTSWIWTTPEDYAQQVLADKREGLAEILARADSAVPESEVKKFEAEYEKYLAKLKPALIMQFAEKHMPYCRFELRLVNEGTAPATDVSLQMVFPEGSSYIAIDKLDATIKIEEIVPEEPATPKWALSSQALQLLRAAEKSLAFMRVPDLSFLTHSSYLPALSSPFISRQVPYDIITFPFDKNILNKEHKKLGHHRQWEITPVIVYLPPSAQEGVPITYSILADELLDPVTGELKVRWEGEI
jgi:hypothetical protein